MPNMTDYVRWRGDLSFAERPFNDVDNLVLSTLAYFDFTDIIPGPGDGSISLAKACQMALSERDGDVSHRVRA